MFGFFRSCVCFCACAWTGENVSLFNRKQCRMQHKFNFLDFLAIKYIYDSAHDWHQFKNILFSMPVHCTGLFKTSHKDVLYLGDSTFFQSLHFPHKRTHTHARTLTTAFEHGLLSVCVSRLKKYTCARIQKKKDI